MREPRTIGLLGGMSWQSSIEYERIINAEVQRPWVAGARPACWCAPTTSRSSSGSRWRLERRGLAVLIPDEPDRSLVHDVIYGELVQGVVSPDPRARYLEAIERLAPRGAEGVVAGCTEIELLVRPADVGRPYFPTTQLHTQAAARWALAGPEAA